MSHVAGRSYCRPMSLLTPGVPAYPAHAVAEHAQHAVDVRYLPGLGRARSNMTETGAQVSAERASAAPA